MKWRGIEHGRPRASTFLGATALILFLAACASSPRIAEPAAADFQAGVDFATIERFSRSYWIMRYRPDEEIIHRVGSAYNDFKMIDIAQTANRIMVGTLFAQRRQDIWIRGTANVVNALYDLDYPLHFNSALGIQLHEGFEKMAVLVHQCILPLLHKDFDLVIFGHSLGGAEAVILAMLLSREGYRIRQVYASGSPRVTTREGRERYRYLPILRILNPGDPVPFLPPQNMVPTRNQFVHLGRAVLLLDGAYYCQLDEDRGDDVLDGAYWPLLGRESLPEQLGAHLIAGYLVRLKPKVASAVQIAFTDRADYLAEPSPAPPDRLTSKAPPAAHP